LAQPKIGMTSFINYFIAQSATKVAKVRTARRMMDGDGFDFWQAMRQAAVTALVAGGDKKVVRAAVTASAGTPKERSYSSCGAELISWIGRKQITARPVGRRASWAGDGLDISVNPELVLTVNGDAERTTKLYCKADRLSKRAADPMLRLIELEFPNRPAAILGVQGKRLFTGPAPKPADLDLLLRAELAAFARIWAGI
jgi:hypothetical protein